jgi:hypothetical protein
VPGEGGLPTEPTAPPAPRRAPSPIGYSNVATLNAAEARAILAAGLTLVQAEAIPFGRGPEAFDVGRLRAIADVVRQHTATFLLTVVNWNGAPQRSAALVRRLTRAVREHVGIAQVWLEGVSEPDGSAEALAAQRAAADEWPGTLVGNGPGGRGTPAVRADIVDWHYCSYVTLLDGVRTRGDRLHSTDCTPILASEGTNVLRVALLSQAQVREVTRAAIDRRRRLILYDTSHAPAANLHVVRWMSEELSR